MNRCVPDTHHMKTGLYKRGYAPKSSVSALYPRPIPLDCSDRAENTRNRKIWFFCFRALSRFFFQLQEKIFFWLEKKMSLENFEMFQNQKIFNGKSTFLVLKMLIFHWKFSDFGTFQNFRATFFFRAKKIFFLGVEKKIWTKLWSRKTISFDCACFQLDPSNPTG